MQFKSKLFSLAEIVNEPGEWKFTIPIYQRLYVWGEDQVLTLLNDIVNAFEREEEIFFLGCTLVVNQGQQQDHHYELIDGQQRFTTLWLLCHAWKHSLEQFLTISEGELTRPRLSFAIRPEVNTFLNSLVFKEDNAEAEHCKSTERMQEAIATMSSLFAKREWPTHVTNDTEKALYLKELSDFVYQRVKLVLTTVPEQTDLNKLFEVINNRGVQLQHHEILKARMLDVFDKDDSFSRKQYATLWDSCSDMENFIERSLAGNSQLKAKEVATLYETSAANRDAEKLANSITVLKALEQFEQFGASCEPLTLDTILNDIPEPTAQAEKPGKGNKPTDSWVRSIVSFPMLLQHTLRIWLHRRGLPDIPRILDRELLVLFEEHLFKVEHPSQQVERVQSFIQLLWELRYLFDKHFIKWADLGEEEVHMICKTNLSTSKSEDLNIGRSRENEANEGFALLQSMLYHSQENTTHYWLTPLLNFVHQNPNNSDAHYHYLRHLDTHLLGANAEGSLVERTRVFLEKPWSENTLIHSNELTNAHGVNFRHYWFYKLEFVLWFLDHKSEPGWQKFRFTAKNSVEHISPQTPIKEDDSDFSKMLDHFGNLSLVSRSLNSEFGNRPFSEKRERFFTQKKSKVDSLKMDLIYRNTSWSDGIAQQHQDDMIQRLNEYSIDSRNLPPEVS